MDRRNRVITYSTNFLIRFYQLIVSPFLVYLLGHSCRYQPTCSQYSHDAFNKYGFTKAIYVTISRILRCNPFSKGGYDPA